MNLTTTEYWKAGYRNIQFSKHNNSHAIYKLIDLYIPCSEDGQYFEIGNYPGAFMSKFGDKGYILNGIDIIPENKTALPEWLKKEGYKINKFIVGDIFDYPVRPNYDVVGSFGFVEHFSNYNEIIKIHASLVKQFGYLIITTPNYRGIFQRIVQKYFAPDNFKYHYLPSMQPENWKKTLTNSGFRIIYAGYWGGANFWIKNERKSLFNKLLFRVTYKIWKTIDKFLHSEMKAYSTYCVIIAQKID